MLDVYSEKVDFDWLLDLLVVGYFWIFVNDVVDLEELGIDYDDYDDEDEDVFVV